MQKLIIAFCLALAACTPPYGNYTKVSDAYNTHMADDTAQELTALYPPAATHFRLSQPTQDAYGAELVKKLRESGYAIETGNSLTALFTSATVQAGSKNTETSPSRKSVGYIVDQMGEGLYRVTVTIDSTSLSRVYTVSRKDMVPAGAWTRKV